MANIDTKSTALLTHISVIIASLVFALQIDSVKEDADAKAFILAEIVFYVMVAALNIRCLHIMGSYRFPGTKDAKLYSEYIMKEYLVRRGVYLLCLRMVYILTLIIPPAVLYHYRELVIEQFSR